MNLYADTRPLRMRQVLTDLAVAGWAVLWCLLGRGLHRTIENLRVAATSAREAGAGLAGTLDDVARRVERLPAVGQDLRRPFAGAADAGRALESAGAAADATVHAAALWVGLSVAVLPTAWLVVHHVRVRLRWAREAAAARAMGDEPEALALLALRALATAPLDRLRRATADPAAAWARREHGPLAAVELERLGLRWQGASAHAQAERPG